MPTLAIFSLNTFGTPSLFGWSRIQKMGDALNQKSSDILCLQEIQTNRYLSILESSLSSTPYFAYKKKEQKPYGGLLTASRFSYTNWAFYPFPNRGRKWSIGYADWALHKGVLCVQVEIDSMPVVVLNTHLQANYLARWVPDNFLASIQKDQVNYLADFVKEQAEKALVVVCGDFNYPPYTFLYAELIERSGLIDPLQYDPRPTYHPFPLVSSVWRTRLDYALYKAPKDVDLSVSVDIVNLEDKSTHFRWSRFLTDHYLLKLMFVW